MVRKIVSYVFICFVGIFLMSQNVFAFEGLPFNTRIVSFYRGSQIRFKPNNTGPWLTNNSYYTFGINTGHGQGFKHVALNNSSGNFPYAAGRYLVVEGQAEFYSMYQGNFNVTGFLGIGAQDTNCPILYFESYPLLSENPDDTWTNTYNVPFTAVCRVTNDTNVSTNLELHAWSTAGVTEASIYFSTISLWEVTSSTSDINNSINAILNWLQNNADDAGETLKQEKQDVQDASDESQDAGDSSTDDAEEGSSSLLSAIGSAVTVISSASPTNCKINGNMGNLNMGQIDLCANPVPSFIQVIGSLILILITVPLCITLFNRFISLFRSFQS